MTPAELHAARTALGMTQGALASALGVGRRTIQQYEAGDRAIPELVARIVRAAIKNREILNAIAAA
ncbi:DNA-binding transcriptional regulator [Acidocella sp.]|uniref:helix-turn-helix domain-containing protein n=1 Tax=Acidocella sp. TaxID=50710 RepID=UPI002619C865|nr:helix-turn-helix transcriptional regulator [Acidocella sp.]